VRLPCVHCDRACRASHHQTVPVHDEAPRVEARAGTRLPAGDVGHPADDGHAVLTLAGDEDLGIGVALVDQVLTRQQVAPFLRLGSERVSGVLSHF
jgi:hypothetical protein